MFYFGKREFDPNGTSSVQSPSPPVAVLPSDPARQGARSVEGLPADVMGLILAGEERWEERTEAARARGGPLRAWAVETVP